jgi:hypothetical protein
VNDSAPVPPAAPRRSSAWPRPRPTNWWTTPPGAARVRGRAARAQDELRVRLEEAARGWRRCGRSRRRRAASTPSGRPPGREEQALASDIAEHATSS